VLVPADVREINVRIENARLGKVWFDDVKIVKGNTSQTVIVEESNYYPFGLKHKGYNNVISSNGNSTAQKFGFGGKELNEELGLEWHDFGARNYDASLGRWMNLDPLGEKMYEWSPYNYVLNNPLIFIDPDGEYPILITTRSYAPYKTFGPGNKWHGDGRGHSNSRNASSRTSVTITHDTRTRETTAVGGQSRSYTTDGKRDATSRTSVDNRSKGEKIDVHSYGNNAAQKGSWDIDQFTKLDAKIDGDIDSEHTLNVTGTISGDDFPNQESIVTDSEGNTVTLGTFETSGDRQSGPVTDLPFENEGDVNIKVNVSIKVDKNGVFQGVMVGKKMMSIADWNKQFKPKEDETKI
jgi:RHS repeat-associated protein